MTNGTPALCFRSTAAFAAFLLQRFSYRCRLYFLNIYTIYVYLCILCKPTYLTRPPWNFAPHVGKNPWLSAVGSQLYASPVDVRELPYVNLFFAHFSLSMWLVQFRSWRKRSMTRKANIVRQQFQSPWHRFTFFRLPHTAWSSLACRSIDFL